MVELVVDYVRGGRQHLPLAESTWLSRRVTATCRNPRRMREHYWGELWDCPACKPQEAQGLDGDASGAGFGIAYAVVVRGDQDGRE